MRSTNAGAARPVRTVENSPCVCVTAFCIDSLPSSSAASSSSWSISRSGSDEDLGEAGDLGRAKQLLNALLFVFGVRLVEKNDVLVKTSQTAFDDFGHC